MGIGSGIEHNAIVAETYLLHLVNQFTLDITLIIAYLDVRVTSLQLGQILVERRRAVDARFARTQEIEIGSVDDLYFHISNIFITFAGKSTK